MSTSADQPHSAKDQHQAAEHRNSVNLPVQTIHDLALKLLLQNGLSQLQAEPVAQAIMAGERDECHSHGLYRLPGCVETILSKNFNRNAEPELRDTSLAVTHIDAKFGYSLPAFELGLPHLERKAKALGVSVLAINNCFHFSALWPEVEAITARGLAALILTPSHAWVAPAGGSKPLLGTNPIGFGYPRKGKNPYVFDFATSAIARGDISLHKIAGKPIPLGWGVDHQGNPTTSAQEVLDGAMLTFGGHKGSALSTMVELLAGPLINDMTSQQSLDFDDGAKAAPCHGELIIAFDPHLLGLGQDEANEARVDALLSGFSEQGARMPSQRRFAARERSLKDGVHIAKPLYDRVISLLEETT